MLVIRALLSNSDARRGRGGRSTATRVRRATELDNPMISLGCPGPMSLVLDSARVFIAHGAVFDLPGRLDASASPAERPEAGHVENRKLWLAKTIVECNGDYRQCAVRAKSIRNKQVQHTKIRLQLIRTKPFW